MIALIALVAFQFDPIALLMSVRDRYQKLDSLRVTIEHHNDSGLFPGEYTQKLEWQQGGRFELKVTKPVVGELPKGHGAKAPDFFGDGAKVTLKRPDGSTDVREYNTNPNMLPGYEVSGGLILSFLLHGSGADWLFKPPAGDSVKMDFGSATTWRGQSVRDIRVSWPNVNGVIGLDIYVSADGTRLLGMESSPEAKLGYMIYKDERDNPILMPDLGTYGG